MLVGSEETINLKYKKLLDFLAVDKPYAFSLYLYFILIYPNDVSFWLFLGIHVNSGNLGESRWTFMAEEGTALIFENLAQNDESQTPTNCQSSPAFRQRRTNTLTIIQIGTSRRIHHGCQKRDVNPKTTTTKHDHFLISQPTSTAKTERTWSHRI